MIRKKRGRIITNGRSHNSNNNNNNIVKQRQDESPAMKTMTDEWPRFSGVSSLINNARFSFNSWPALHDHVIRSVTVHSFHRPRRISPVRVATGAKKDASFQLDKRFTRPKRIFGIRGALKNGVTCTGAVALRGETRVYCSAFHIAVATPRYPRFFIKAEALFISFSLSLSLRLVHFDSTH